MTPSHQSVFPGARWERATPESQGVDARGLEMAHEFLEDELGAGATRETFVVRHGRVIWDNAPAHRGPEIRAYLTTPEVNLRLVALPGYSPDFNLDEAIWDWIRADVTANTCFGTAATVRQQVEAFFAGLAERAAEAQQRCRRDLQAQADAFMEAADQMLAQTEPVDHTLESV